MVVGVFGFVVEKNSFFFDCAIFVGNIGHRLFSQLGVGWCCGWWNNGGAHRIFIRCGDRVDRGSCRELSKLQNPQ